MTKRSTDSVGVFTTDRDLVVHIWDPALARLTGISAESAAGQSLKSVIPDLERRGLLKHFQRVLREGVVEVLAPAFHKYLVRCAPAHPATHFDHMRQRVTIAPLEESGGIAGLIVTVEDVTARQDRERDGGVGIPGDAGSDTLLEALHDESWRVRKAAVEQMSVNAAPEAIAALLRSVRDHHHHLGLLNSALRVLTLSNVDTQSALVEFLGSPDSDLRIQAALALGEQCDSRSIAPLMKALEDPNVNVVYHAIEALGKLRALEVCEKLAAIAETRDFFLAFPALEALGNIGDPRMCASIVPLLGDEMLRDAAAHALAKLGDESTVSALVDLLNTSAAPAEVIASSLAVLYDRYEHVFGEGEHIADLCSSAITAHGVQNLLSALADGAPENLRALVLVLGWQDSLAGVRALTLHLGSPELRTEIIDALVRHGKSVTELVLEQLKSEDLDIRWSAVTALGRIRDSRAAPALIRLLETNEELTLPIVAALSAIADPIAQDALFGLVGNTDAAVRRAAVAAINALATPQMTARVVSLLDDPNPAAREAGVRIAGYFGYRQTVDVIFLRCRDDDERVRCAAIEHLPYLEDPRAPQELGRALREDTKTVRAAAALALGNVDSPDAVPFLIAALDDGDSWVRYFTARALGMKRAGEVAGLLEKLALSDKYQQVRIATFEALSRVDEDRAVSVAKSFLSATDLDLQQAVAEAAGRMSHPESFRLLVDSLRSPYSTVRATTVTMLGNQTNPEALDHIRRVAVIDADPLVMKAAISALRQAPTRGGTSALMDLLNDPVRREFATAALARPGNLDVETLNTGLRHPSAAVRLALVNVFERLKTPGGTDSLRLALNDSEPSVRVAAARALARNHRHAAPQPPRNAIGGE